MGTKADSVHSFPLLPSSTMREREKDGLDSPWGQKSSSQSRPRFLRASATSMKAAKF